ncbi:polymer-forming cytoskeletal protein [Marinilabiliaceae bacterium JC040]|nr:polymer-forming cytoskeletal protein [Marinilabiliaceae bacterium JC040]
MAKTDSQSYNVNIICEKSVITGDFVSNSDIRIDGTLNGNLTSVGRIFIGEKGLIKGNIKCNNIEVLGTVKGNIVADDIVTLKSKANIEGDIETKRLQVEPGIIFNGNCKMSSTSAPKSKDK